MLKQKGDSLCKIEIFQNLMKSAKLLAEMCLQHLMNMEVNEHCDRWDKFRA